MKRPLMICLSIVAAFAASAIAVATGPDGDADGGIPVLWESPACAHGKLGLVDVEVGTKVNESTQDERVPVVRVAPAFAKLAGAAVAAGGNAVVLRSHQGVYFTHNGRRSSAPVYIRLRGAVVTLPDDGAACDLLLVDARDLEQRMRDGTPGKVWAHQAYTDD